jgi:hypothetical protein
VNQSHVVKVDQQLISTRQWCHQRLLICSRKNYPENVRMRISRRSAPSPSISGDQRVRFLFHYLIPFDRIRIVWYFQLTWMTPWGDTREILSHFLSQNWFTMLGRVLLELVHLKPNITYRILYSRLRSTKLRMLHTVRNPSILSYDHRLFFGF